MKSGFLKSAPGLPSLPVVAEQIAGWARQANPHIRTTVLERLTPSDKGRSVVVRFALSTQKLERCYPLCDNADVVILRSEVEEDTRELCEMVGRAWTPSP